MAAHCPHTGDNLLSSLAPQWAASSPAPLSQWAMSPYRHVAQPANPQRPPQPPAFVANPPGRPGPSHNQWQPITSGLYNTSEGPRCNHDPCKLPTAAAHVGDLILPPCAMYHSIQKE